MTQRIRSKVQACSRLEAAMKSSALLHPSAGTQGIVAANKCLGHGDDGALPSSHATCKKHESCAKCRSGGF